MDRLGLDEILKKETDYVNSHFEPFKNSTDCVLSKLSQNFDASSQMMSNSPQCATSVFKPNSQPNVDMNETGQEEADNTRLRDTLNRSMSIKSYQMTQKIATADENNSNLMFNLADLKSQTEELSQSQTKQREPSVNNLNFSLDDLENRDCDI